MVVLCCSIGFSLSDLNNIVGISTPIILLMWFYFSQRLNLSNKYFSEVVGNYAGFTETLNLELEKKENGRIYSGIIMRIVDIDANGYFKGEFQYGENLTVTGTRALEFHQIMEGVYTFLGKIDFQLYLKKNRHPYKVSDNRKYLGKLYIVDRLDYQYEKYDFETYMKAEYDIIHFREMKAIKFMFVKANSENFELPKEFILDRQIDLSFSPLENVKSTAFKGDQTLEF
ncbi:hypothetical protein HDF18_12170 [Mucilaginibacter sp. X5P1]|uniref:hypothetical protein n=1 Tax=Mucilaginibacter sp. X5P1 TaxID=2723088 RepID=UPI001617D64C|nr:hypothetical protein [Mucilaginibacter sp. X5P1]MBB6140426.1 hypothetical protein [Mucilaginibacter sp. X5P1]